MPDFDSDHQIVEIVFVDNTGKTVFRRIKPNKIFFESNKSSSTPQWLVQAYDLDKSDQQTFALKDIRAWLPIG